jgi:carboxyl-terminal processing protease
MERACSRVKQAAFARPRHLWYDDGMRTARFAAFGGLVLAVSAAVGGYVGRTSASGQERLPEQYRAFTAALRLVETNYVEKVPTDRVVYSAITGMLQTLDPHSSFLDPRTYAQMRERQEGRYFGLGITIQVVDGDVTAVSLFEGSPAYKKGVRRGDVIARIGGESAKGITSDEAVRRLRGPKGTLVKISLRRRGYDQLIDLEVPRDEIHMPTVPAAFLLDGGIGYVRLQDFAEQTDNDLAAALERLTKAGMTRLLLDLRNNPGGPLDQAIKVANQFLAQGQMIVYTRGRVPNSAQDYRATEKRPYTQVPLVVLANRGSASASEIIAGALQDHDRAVIVGETTFGKALVQSVFRISESAGLALTTARYYTPSGRLIQRPWDGTFDEYLMYTAKEQGRERPRLAADLKYTDGGRKVYGGGGIEPDHYLEGPIEGFNPAKYARTVYARQAFSSFAQKFSVEGDTRITVTAKDGKTVAQGFAVDAAMLDAFREHLRAEKIPVDEAGFTQDAAFIASMIRYEINVNLFGVAEARRHLIETDPQATLALGQFPEAERLIKGTKSPAVPAAAGK